jgi:pteridine reductase
MVKASEAGQTKVALVTGGARRIGAEIARRLHAGGMNVAVHYNTSREDARVLCDGLNEARPASARAFAADLRDLAAVRELVASVTNAFTRLDVLVNNASSYFATPLGSIDEAAYEDLLGTNLKAPLFLSQAAAPHLRQARGCIVNIADIYGIEPIVDHAVYCPAKAGLIMLTRALATDLAPDVRVNAVAPGAILWPETAPDETLRTGVLAKVPMGRTGHPADIGEAVHYLIEDAHYVTGQVIKVDGGRAIG